MAEKLLVRLGAESADKLEWLNLAEPDSRPTSGTMAELAAAAQGKSVLLLLPAASVLLLEIELAVKTTAQLKKALPFALEDLLAEDVENYHLVWLKQDRDKLAVAAITHDTLSARLTPFREAGLELAAAYPETLCLPYQPGQTTLLLEESNAILRSAAYLGGGVDAQFLPQLLEKACAEGVDCQTLLICKHSEDTQLPDGLANNGLETVIAKPLQFMASAVESLPAELNLLSGAYAVSHRPKGSWQQWLPAAIILAAALAVQSYALLHTYWQQQAELSELEAKSQELFKQTFPDVKRIVNVKAQAEQQLAQLRKQQAFAGSGFMRLIYRSGLVLKDAPAVHLKKLNFLNGGLQLHLLADDIGQLEQFKQQLQSSMQVKIQSADSGANGVEAQLEIREK
ncbi:type II secretion system protein GspL [Methylomonas sp. EFPC1]|uniref:type II secretion system protein GspL n=1 Tax=Methylomonas sp. EFPC1 TaxID=2812647 RepID=UPI00196802EF|nr:type II secretion system protein GspL [Methylomonas sp. EFPC1]QSB02877.1 type II secretion system protein GspL [Methylomonas sp. EFPC1]